MKHEAKYAALAAAMMLAWGTANAQTPARTERSSEFSQSLSYQEYLKGEDLRASKLVGARVRNAVGDSLGEIEELVIASKDRDDMLVIVSVGGLLDVGDKLVALPYDDLRVSPDGDTFYIDRTEAQLKAAPAFTYDAQAEVQARSERPVERDAPRVDRDGPRVDRDPPRAPAATVQTAERPRTTAANTTTVAKSNVVLDVFDYRASDLIGATVLDDRGETVGKVDDIVVSTEDDKLHAVLAIGGFVGIGAKLVSIPFDDLQITSNDDNPQVRIAMTGEQLQQLVASRPEFRYERQVAQAPGTAPRG
jgi:sporulation protein YlmC with PRC-barrel domain